VRAASSAITTFDPPGAHGFTIPSSINTAGAIAGSYFNANGAYRGFVRVASGAFITFEAPGAGTAARQGTLAYGINTAGAITGYYIDATNDFHGYVRAAGGAFTTFEAPGALTGAGGGTVGESINAAVPSRGTTGVRAMSSTASCDMPKAT
jgi:hypothetical protein